MRGLKSVGLTLLLVCSTTIALSSFGLTGRSLTLAQSTTTQNRKAAGNYAIAAGNNSREDNSSIKQRDKSSSQALLSQGQSDKKLEGVWNITEAKTPDGRAYAGTVTMLSVNDVEKAYSLFWETSIGKRAGVAFFEDGHLFVSWTSETANAGIVIYRIGNNGLLDGRWLTGRSGGGQAGTEIATGNKPGQIEGIYQVTGVNQGGSSRYKGTLQIDKVGDTYQLLWKVGNIFRGVGFRSGDWLIVSWGGNQPLGIADYKLDGSQAKGRWSAIDQPNFGVENLTLKVSLLSNSLGRPKIAEQKKTQGLRTDRGVEAARLIQKGNQLIGKGESKAALQYYQQALKIYQELKDRRKIGFALASIGEAYFSLSNYAKSFKYYQQALIISGDIDQQTQALALGGLGGIYSVFRNYAKSIEFYQRALVIARNTRSQKSEEDTLRNLGNIYYAFGGYQKAIEYYQKALQVAEISGNLQAKGKLLNNLGNAHYALGSFSKSISYYLESLLISQKTLDRYTEGLTLLNLGDVYFSIDNFSRSRSYYQKALTLSRITSNRRLEGRALSNIGAVLNRTRQAEVAIIFYKQAVNVSESIRQDIRQLPRDQQESFVQDVAEVYRSLADILLQQDRVFEAQQVLELLKVQEFEGSLKEFRGEPQPIVFRKAEVELLKQFQAQQKGAVNAAQELIALQSKAESERTKADRDRIQHLIQLQERMNEDFIAFITSQDVQALVEKLRRKDGGSIDPEMLGELRTKLSNQLAKLPNTALLYPLILDNRLELILITADSAPLRRTVMIDRGTLNKAISNFSVALQNPQQDAKPSAQKLYEILIQPLENDLRKANIKTLLYSPDRRLRYIPLTALYDGKQWLIERFQISYVTTNSVTDLTTPRQSQPRVLAGAISSNKNQRYVVELATTRREFGGLPNVIPEIAGIASTLPSTRQLRDRAFTIDAVKELSRQYNILHFATHGSFERAQPELSFLLFGEKSSNGKNFATLRDIGTWRLNVDLVVLSACETGLADDQLDTKADDGVTIMGLGYQFEKVGARATIASLWLVNDSSTSLLMQQFYQNLARSKTTKAQALQEAQRSFLSGKLTAKDAPRRSPTLAPKGIPMLGRSQSTDFSHPYYWAPFILIGNGL